MLLITGANGKLGRLIVEEVLLRAPDAPLAVSVRDASAAADLARRGVEVRQADYHELDSVRAAFAGVDRLLLMPTPTPDPEERVAEMVPVAQVAAEVGVKHVVYPGAAEVDGLDFPLLRSHTRVYEAIVATGVHVTHLRVSIYAEVVANDVAGALHADELAAPVNGARVAPVLRSDIAPAIAAVLNEDGHEGKVNDLTGHDAAQARDAHPRRDRRDPRRHRELTAMELGIISLSDLTPDPHTGRPVAAIDRLHATLAHARAADELGLDVFALGEHHSHKFAVASPAVVLAAIAGQTDRIRLASGVTVLSALDPVRVYQDFAQLDLLSHGRAEIIAGRSAFAEPFALFGAAINDYDELFAEKLDLLLRLREQDRITWSGRYRARLVDAQISPRALQDPLPVWVGVGGTPTSAARAGHLGLPMMLGFIGGTLAHARRAVEVYRAAGDAAGHDPDTLQVGISTHFYAAASEQDATDVFDHYRTYLHATSNNGRGWIV